jgi:hypothetical protein
VDALAARLEALPAVTGARVERHLPGTLVVRVGTRVPRAWIACPDAGIPAERRVGALLLDHSKVAYPCPDLQFEAAEKLPIIVLSPSAEHEIKPGGVIRHPALQPCLSLLDSTSRTDARVLESIDSIRQSNVWSLLLTTRGGTCATFGLRDHPRQIRQLRAALDHATHKGYTIETINLIPRENIPITLRSEPAPPRAIPVREPSPDDLREARRNQDLNALLNRD